MALRGLVCFALLTATCAPAGAQVINERDHCVYNGDDGCLNVATYDADYDRTSWSKDCDDGFFITGTMAGNQVPTFCLGVSE